MEDKTLKHFGIKGMRWGVRRHLQGSVDSRYRKNSEKALRDVRFIYGNKGSGKNPSKMTTKEIDDEITSISSGRQNAKVIKRIEQANLKLMKEQKISQAKSAEWSKGKKAAVTVLATIGTLKVIDIVASGALIKFYMKANGF